MVFSIRAFAAICLIWSGVVTSVYAQTPGSQKWSGDGLRLEIAPLPKDTVKAFFIGRDFSAKDAGFIATTGCVFRSAIGNAGSGKSDADIQIDLAKWRVVVQGKRQPLMTRQDWEPVLKKRGIGETPAIAFHWSLFPTKQQYKPTDYNWGLLTFALPQQSRFDLQVVWQQGNKRQQHIFKNLECGK